MSWEIVWTILCACGIPTAIVGAGIKYIKKILAAKKTEDAAVNDGLKSLLRGDIIHSHDKYSERGYCPIYAREALEKEYQSYHNLGGNGVVTHLMEEIRALPTEKSNE